MTDYRLQPGLLGRLDGVPRKVAVVRASRLGDFICATPALRALRAALPSARITLIAQPFARDLAQRSPHVDDFLGFPGFPGMAEQFFEPRQVLGFVRSLREDPFDLAIQMHGSGVNANPFALMLGARLTAGFVRQDDPPGGLDAAFLWNPDRHELWRCLEFMSFLGAEPRGERTEFVLSDEDHLAAERLLAAAERPLIGVHPGAAEAMKRWPAASFGQAAASLRAQLGGTVVVFGGRSDRAAAAQVMHAVGKHALNLAGKTSLPFLGAVLSRLALLLANDSGPAHMAYALDVPSVTVFGGTRPSEWGPLVPGKHQVAAVPVDCRPCSGDSCPHGFRCLRELSPGQVERLALRAGQYHSHLHVADHTLSPQPSMTAWEVPNVLATEPERAGSAQ